MQPGTEPWFPGPLTNTLKHKQSHLAFELRVTILFPLTITVGKYVAKPVSFDRKLSHLDVFNTSGIQH